MQPANAMSKTALDAGQVNWFRDVLLTWYDTSRRRLPWRALPGLTADPYHVWLSEIMLQQTVVAAVIPYFLKFIETWPTVFDLAAASQDEVLAAWAGLGYYSRARNLHKCAQRIVADHDGIFPSVQPELKKLPGIGDYTSAAITAIAWNKPAVVIDGNVERVITRFFAITTPLPLSKREIKSQSSLLAENRTDRPGDFAQAMMDLGATICTPRSPACALCPLQRHCVAYREGLQRALPYKEKTKAKPVRYGYVYWIQDDKGRVLLQRRPETGLLGGMMGFPGSNWEANMKDIRHLPNIKLHKKIKDIKVTHTFTHFHLELTGLPASVSSPSDFQGESWKWVENENIKKVGLPTLFNKFLRLMYLTEKEKI